MITLITGVPGSGKTLYALHHIKKRAETENRQVYCHGIKGLALPWNDLEDPKAWDGLPDGSIIVIDECQSVFRPRGAGSAVPPYIAALETHRHKGYDIFLITQHPMLVDQNIRRLVGQHFHVIRRFGIQSATVHEWGTTHEITQRNILSAVKHRFPYPKEVFSYYKSAELHTHKKRIPLRVYFLFAVPFIIAALVYVASTRLKSTPPESAPVKSGTGAVPSVMPGSKTTATLSAAEYIAVRDPRIPNQPWTAPVFDNVTDPVEAPYPVACVESSKGCRCFDQQNVRIAVGDGFCRDFLANGMFIPWERRQNNSDHRRDRQDDRNQRNSVSPPLAMAPFPE